MPINEWSIICAKPIVDNRTKAISLIEHVEAITIHGGASTSKLHLPFALVSFWSRTDIENGESFYFRVVAESPTGKQQLTANHPELIDLVASSKARLLTMFSPFDLDEFGRYKFLLQTSETNGDDAEWTTRGVAYLDINLVSPESERALSEE